MYGCQKYILSLEKNILLNSNFILEKASLEKDFSLY